LRDLYHRKGLKQRGGKSVERNRSVTTFHAAEMLGVTRWTIYRYIREGLLDASKPRGVLLVSLDSINKLLEDTKVIKSGAFQSS
jgi:excisionase family DNA binding protein